MTRFPPRAELPRTISIDKVTMLGTTWYERGAGYWVRRCWMVVLGGGILALLTTIAWVVLGEIRQASVTAFRVVLGVEIAYSLLVIVTALVLTARHWNGPWPPERQPARRRLTGLFGALVRVGWIVTQIVLGLSAALVLGVYVTLFLLMLTPETVWERPARVRMADLLRRRGYDVS